MSKTIKRELNKNIHGKNKVVSGKKFRIPFLPLILLLTIIVFYQSITKIFIALDDQAYIQDNPFIKSLGWQNIIDIFSSFYNGNYHPLTTVLYAIEWNLFGNHAESWHIVSLLLHLANVYLVWVLFRKLSNKREIAIIGTAIFAIHPMHVESVVWISEQKDVLYTFFYLLGLSSYITYVKENNNFALFKAIVLFLFSLMSKSAAVTFPLVLFCLDYYYSRSLNKKIIFEKIPFLLLSFLFGILAVLSQNAAGAINDSTMVPYSFFQRIFVVSFSLVYYIVKFIIPFDLTVLHYAPKQLSFYYYLCPLIIILIGWIAYKSKRLRHILVFGLLFYLFAIILVVQIIPVGYVLVSERYSYVPYIALSFIFGHLFLALKERRINYPNKYLTGYVVLVLILVYSYLSLDYIKKWQSSVLLFSDIVKKNPESAYALYSYGKVQNINGDPDGAVTSYNKAVTLDTTIAEVYFCRGTILFNQKKYDLALKDYLMAEKLKPVYQENLNNLAFLYSEMGRMDESIEYYGKAIAVKPTEYLYQRRATCYTFQKKYREALADYAKTIEMNPDLSEAYFNRGVCYYYTQHIDSACIDWSKAAAMGYETAKNYSEKFCKK
jgi:tetratricopeptide (TPR) repeat protein